MYQGNTSQEDLVIGGVGLVIFLVAVFLAGFALNKFQNWRFSKVWTPLVPVINGRYKDDGGGATSSWLVGEYQGRQVGARMAPNLRMGGGLTSSTSGRLYNHFEITIADCKGPHDWQVSYDQPLLGAGEADWQIKCKDAATTAHLERVGVVAMIATLGYPTIEYLPTLAYSARRNTLVFIEDAAPAQIPAADRFREELDVLLKIAAVCDPAAPAA
jgi:hypothetical protein